MIITENCIVNNMPEEAYHRDPTPDLEGFTHSASLSASTACDILERTEKDAFLSSYRLNPLKKKSEGSDATELGDIAHAYVLRHGEAQKVYEVVPVDAWRSNDAKAARDNIEARGLIALNTTTSERLLGKVKGMHQALHEQLARHEDFPGLMLKGAGEQSGFAKHGNIWLRARFDWLDENYPDVIADYKTTGLSFESWEREIWSSGRWLQDPHYRMTLDLIRNRPGASRWIWVVQQTFEPFHVRIFQMEAHVVEDAEKRWKIARDRFENCLRTGEWRGQIPKTFHTCPPPWIVQRWENDETYAKIMASEAKKRADQEVRMAG